MDLMTIVHSYDVREFALRFVVVLFLVGGLASLATGLCLIVNSAGTLRFFVTLNRWISTRRVSKPLDIPRSTAQAAQKYRRTLAAVFFLGGLFASYGLVMNFNDRAAITLLNLGHLKPVAGEWLVESVRWILLVGNLAGVVVAVMLWFFPQALIALEARSAHWYSDRKLSRGADAMNLTLDNWVAASPRAAGAIITFFAAILVVAFGLMLPRM